MSRGSGVRAAMRSTEVRPSGLVVALLAASLMIGCSAAPSDGQAQSNRCVFAAIVFDVGPAICTDAVAVAKARLGWLHWPVTSVKFRSSLCPPFGRCRANIGNVTESWVIFTFSFGDPQMIHVAPPDSGAGIDTALVAGDPEPVPDWLRDELLQQDAPQDLGQPDSDAGG